MPDLRIVFLFLLFLTIVLFTLRNGAPLTTGTLKEMLLDVILVPAFIGTILVFAMLMARIDPTEVFLQVTAWLGRTNTVSFIEAIPPELGNSLDVLSVHREDTDGDGFEEWVVLYKSELQSGNNPIQVIIYDNDRGNPPIIYPYSLQVPGKNVLGFNAASVQVAMDTVTTDANGPSQEDLPELVVTSGNQLGVFRFNQNTDAWVLPTDSPPRYSAIGFFQGNGGVFMDSTSKSVTVMDRDRFNRSQLGWRTIYTLNSAKGIQPTAAQPDSYWLTPALGETKQEVPVLAPPVMSTIDFLDSPPPDIFNTEFPEKIVLAFYAATCGNPDATLCQSKGEDWDPAEFLATNSDAWLNYSSSDGSGYFGLKSLQSTQNIQVKNIQHFPHLEPVGNCIAIEFSLDNAPSQTYAYQTLMIEGQWKISKRLELTECVKDLSDFSPKPQAVSEPGLPPLGSPIQISTSQ